MKHTCWLFILHIIVLRGEKIISFFKKKNLFSQQTLRNLIPVKLNHLDYTIFNIRFPIKTTLSTVKTKNNMEKRATHFFSHLASSCFLLFCFDLNWARPKNASIPVRESPTTLRGRLGKEILVKPCQNMIVRFSETLPPLFFPYTANNGCKLRAYIFPAFTIPSNGR